MNVLLILFVVGHFQQYKVPKDHLLARKVNFISKNQQRTRTSPKSPRIAESARIENVASFTDDIIELIERDEVSEEEDGGGGTANIPGLQVRSRR